MSAAAELDGIVGRGALRVVDELARLARCRVGVFGPDGAPIVADAVLARARPSRSDDGVRVEGVDGASAASAVVVRGRVLGFVVATPRDAGAAAETSARGVVSHGAAVLSELCARESELNDLSREILGNYEELNLSRPEVVRKVHEDFLHAGADIIETNTFGANSLRLARYGIEGRVRDINLAAVKIATKLGAGRRVVTIVPDSAERYLSKQIFGLVARGMLLQDALQPSLGFLNLRFSDECSDLGEVLPIDRRRGRVQSKKESYNQ